MFRLKKFADISNTMVIKRRTQRYSSELQVATYQSGIAPDTNSETIYSNLAVWSKTIVLQVS